MGELIGIIFFPVLAAFLVLETVPTWKFHLRRHTSYYFIFWLLLTAVFINVLSACLITVFGVPLENFCCNLDQKNFFFKEIVCLSISFIKEIFSLALPNIPIDITSLISLAISILIAMFIYFWHKIPDVFYSIIHKMFKGKLPFVSYKVYKQIRREHAYRKSYSKLDHLFKYSINNFSPVMVNLKNRKVYIGWVKDLDSAESKNRCISLVLIASGLRDEGSLIFKIQTPYIKVINELIDEVMLQNDENDKTDVNLDDLELGHIIKIDEIISAVPWIPEVYTKVREQFDQEENS